MHKRLSLFSATAALLWLVSPAGAQASKSVLAPLVPQVAAVVKKAQPITSFGFYRDIFLAQYRTENYTIQPPARAGHKARAYEELGPVKGGFYLELEVVKGHSRAVRATPPNRQEPWTTVTSYYPLSGGHRMIVMTWEAGLGAPHGLAQRVRQVLLANGPRL